MSREIKFRFINNHVAGSDGRAVTIYMTLDELQKCHPLEALYDDVWSRDQFTGLHDKKGKEIWEGDVVKTFAYKKKNIGVIYFQPTRLNWSVRHSVFTNQDMFVYARPDFSIEVIGNIHEHPELLEVK